MWFSMLLSRTRRADKYRTGVGTSAQDQRSQRRTDQVRLGLSAAVSEATIGAFGVLRKYCPGGPGRDNHRRHARGVRSVVGTINQRFGSGDSRSHVL